MRKRNHNANRTEMHDSGGDESRQQPVQWELQVHHRLRENAGYLSREAEERILHKLYVGIEHPERIGSSKRHHPRRAHCERGDKDAHEQRPPRDPPGGCGFLLLAGGAFAPCGGCGRTHDSSIPFEHRGDARAAVKTRLPRTRKRTSCATKGTWYDSLCSVNPTCSPHRRRCVSRCLALLPPSPYKTVCSG